MPCFVDATNSRVAGISGHGMFSFPLMSFHPIFEAEFLAFFFVWYLFSFAVFQQGLLMIKKP